jgi:hypothetical protein
MLVGVESSASPMPSEAGGGYVPGGVGGGHAVGFLGLCEAIREEVLLDLMLDVKLHHLHFDLCISDLLIDDQQLAGNITCSKDYVIN